jgi:hypothetical protein
MNILELGEGRAEHLLAGNECSAAGGSALLGVVLIGVILIGVEIGSPADLL